MDLLFGFANAPSQFTRVMNCLLALNPKLRKFVAVYIHDVIIHSFIKQQHMYQVQENLQLWHSAGLLLKQSKCEWFQNEIVFCGFQIGQEYIHTVRAKPEEVATWSQPRNWNEVWGFLGVMRSFCKFILHSTHVMLVLYHSCRCVKKIKMRGWHGEPSL